MIRGNNGTLTHQFKMNPKGRPDTSDLPPPTTVEELEDRHELLGLARQTEAVIQRAEDLAAAARRNDNKDDDNNPNPGVVVFAGLARDRSINGQMLRMSAEFTPGTEGLQGFNRLDASQKLGYYNEGFQSIRYTVSGNGDQIESEKLFWGDARNNTRLPNNQDGWQIDHMVVERNPDQGVINVTSNFGFNSDANNACTHPLATLTYPSANYDSKSDPSKNGKPWWATPWA
ncbi:hypothetical protein JST97_04645 [bacterium]|nr:hypothetical protein [bacterium]